LGPPTLKLVRRRVDIAPLCMPQRQRLVFVGYKASELAEVFLAAGLVCNGKGRTQKLRRRSPIPGTDEGEPRCCRRSTSRPSRRHRGRSTSQRSATGATHQGTKPQQLGEFEIPAQEPQCFSIASDSDYETWRGRATPPWTPPRRCGVQQCTWWTPEKQAPKAMPMLWQPQALEERMPAAGEGVLPLQEAWAHIRHLQDPQESRAQAKDAPNLHFMHEGTHPCRSEDRHGKVRRVRSSSPVGDRRSSQERQGPLEAIPNQASHAEVSAQEGADTRQGPLVRRWNGGDSGKEATALTQRSALEDQAGGSSLACRLDRVPRRDERQSVLPQRDNRQDYVDAPDSGEHSQERQERAPSPSPNGAKGVEQELRTSTEMRGLPLQTISSGCAVERLVADAPGDLCGEVLPEVLRHGHSGGDGLGQKGDLQLGSQQVQEPFSAKASALKSQDRSQEQRQLKPRSKLEPHATGNHQAGEQQAGEEDAPRHDQEGGVAGFAETASYLDIVKRFGVGQLGRPPDSSSLPRPTQPQEDWIGGGAGGKAGAHGGPPAAAPAEAKTEFGAGRLGRPPEQPPLEPALEAVACSREREVSTDSQGTARVPGSLPRPPERKLAALKVAAMESLSLKIWGCALKDLPPEAWCAIVQLVDSQAFEDELAR
jgi:hypothetical protein